MLLFESVRTLEMRREVTAAYVYQLKYAVRRLGLFLERDATTDDLDEVTINRWLINEQNGGKLSPRSRANLRTSICTIWKFQKHECNRDRIRAVRVPQKNPEAWTIAQMLSVAEAAKQLPGNLASGVPRAMYFEALCNFVYETGLRRGDAWNFRLSSIDAGRVAALTQSKTKRVHLVTMRMETLAMLRSVSVRIDAHGKGDPDRPLRWPQSVSQFYYWIKRCRAVAGIDAECGNRSTQHWRRTGATAIDAAGGVPHRFLGHARPGLDRLSYVDQRQTAKPQLPPQGRAG